VVKSKVRQRRRSANPIDIFENIDDTKVIVARLVSGGMTISKIAAFLGASFQSVYRLVLIIREESQRGVKVKRPHEVRGKIVVSRIPLKISFFPNKGRKVPKEKLTEAKRLLVKTNLTPSEIAARLELRSRSCIYRIREDLDKKNLKRAGSFQPKSKSHRCAKHGDVSVWPCVACEAEKYRVRNPTMAS
jgi:hypothetical protein